LIFKVPAIHAQFKKVIAAITIAIFKAVMKLLPPGSFNCMGTKAEVVAQGKQGIFMNPPFILTIKVGKDPSVLSQ
jgi:hypothetical protein